MIGRRRHGRDAAARLGAALICVTASALSVVTAVYAQPSLQSVGVPGPATDRSAMNPVDGSMTGKPPAHDGTGPEPGAPSGLFGRDSAWWVPLSSALVPGMAQIRLGQNRFVAYLAVEAYAVMGWANDEADVRREGQRYRALAHDIARAFVPGNNAQGDWDYYEAMEKHLESGVFDRAPGAGGLAPETTTATFNGEVWLKARQLSDWASVDVEPPHSSTPYQNAISYYIAHAVRPEFRWSWRNAQLEWDVYRQSIQRKNDASHEASNYLAVIAFNHLLSTIDAFVTLRLRGGLGANRNGYRLTATVPLPQ